MKFFQKQLMIQNKKSRGFQQLISHEKKIT